MYVVTNFEPKKEIHLRMAAKAAKLPAKILPYAVDAYGNIFEGHRCLCLPEKEPYEKEVALFWEAVDILHRKVFMSWKEKGYDVEDAGAWSFYFGITEEEVLALIEKSKSNRLW